MVPAAETHDLKPQGANDGGLTTHYAATRERPLVRPSSKLVGQGAQEEPV